ncbi:helix-turn-helix transcriptional regulator [Streptomyces caeruleatus]|uniref:LuxR family transcriptional regulator n=1 Tax=Streptomyces caeruleatus TaxID=661399 RepID=A0A101U7I9_9ACTN|nr:LuxR C-terminal-related transcriptional regulator [Streptomyces caeruleatus]KUO05568.1 LuxR family transcriptional regulator [Streptomyces caeruleatus]
MQPIWDISMRPDDGDAFRQALRLAQRRCDFPVVFGGPVQGEVLHLTQHIGVQTAGLRGLCVLAATGLGGHVLVERRSAAVADYGSDDSITHDYDAPVLAERIRSVVAVPVVVAGSVRGVLYGATRASTPLGDRATDAMAAASRRLATELAVRDEVDRRLRFRLASETGTGHGTSHNEAEEIRELHAELRVIAQTVRDDSLRDRLLDVSRRLAGLGAAQAPGSRSRLSPREIDVLAQVALGCSNVEAAVRLSLKPETVKAYLRSAMRKLNAHTRFEAVVAARRGGLLP